MLDCPCTQTRRSFLAKSVGAAGAVLALGLTGRFGDAAFAQQEPQVTSEILARGTLGYSEYVDGPAEVYTVRIFFQPGATLPWHTHPGPVFGVVNSGVLTADYDTFGCRTSFGAGEALYVPRGLTHFEHNDGTSPLEVVSTFIVPNGSALRVAADQPAGRVCK